MKKLIFIFSVLCLCVFSVKSFALNSQSLHYYFPGSRALGFVESKPKPTDTLTLGFGFNYAHQPLEFGNSAGNNRVSGIVDHLFTFDFNASYSFSDRVALGLGIPVHLTNNVATLNGTNMETPMNIGDIMLSGQVNIIDPESNNMGFGLGAVPFVTFPTGRTSDYVGEAHVTGGVLVVGDMQVARHYFGLNLGVRLRQEENFLNLDVAHELLYGAVYHVNIIPEFALDGFVELAGATVMKDFFQREVESPFETRVGVTKSFLSENQLKVTGFGGFGLDNGYGNPDLRMGIKIAYDHLLPRTREVVKVIENKIERVEKELKELTIYYPTDGAQVDPFYDQKIAAIARILEDNPDLGPIYIVGHTDSVGSNAYNQRLSERRAGQAATSIISHGLDPKSIVWVGLGEDYPVVDNATDANRALNRRTLFTFIKPTQLTERNTKRGIVGINTMTGKKNDSYTEVLKELDTKTQVIDEGEEAVVMKKYKDNSEVIVEQNGSTVTKESSEASPKAVPVTARSTKVYKTKQVQTVKTGDGEILEEKVIEEPAPKKENKFIWKSKAKKNDTVVEEDLKDDTKKSSVKKDVVEEDDEEFKNFSF